MLDGICNTLPIPTAPTPSSDDSTQQSKIDLEQARQYLELQFKDVSPDNDIKQRIHFSYVKNHQIPPIDFGDIEEALEWLKTANPDDLYVAVNCTNGSIDEKKGILSRTTKNISGVTALPLDVDVEAFKTKQEARDFCYRNPKLTPTYIVDSGNGYHAYFKFHKMIDVTTDEQRDKIREMGRRLKATYEDGHLFEGVKGGLDSVFDTPRVLRLPGTFNCKTSERKPVRIISDPILSGNTYSIDDFDNLLIKTDKIKVITAENIQSVCSLSSVEWSSQDEDDFLFLCGMNDGKNKRFIDYCNGQFHGDRSKAELNLCGNLYWYFRTQKHLTHDEALSKTDAKIRFSLPRHKWDKIHRQNPRMTYGQMTLAKVTLDRKENIDAKQAANTTLILPFCFWYETEIRKIPVLKINIEELYQHLQSIGFYNTKINDQKYFIRLIDNVIEVADITDVRHYLTNEMVDALPEKISDNFRVKDLSCMIRTQIDTLITAGKLSTIAFKKLTLNQDTLDSTSFFFKNGFVKVIAKGAELLPYSKLDGVIWKEFILDREISLKDAQGSDYEEFCKNLCTIDDQNLLVLDRFNTLKTAQGYLLNRFNNPAYQKAVILCDTNTSMDTNGGSGKSIIGNALGYLRNRVEINGRTLRLDDKFSFQQINLNTQIVDFDDLKQNFDFSSIFNCLTSSYSIEQKNKARITFAPANNPKTLMKTNYSIKGIGFSYERRKIEVEIYPFYGKHRNPEDDFGILFNSWDETEWNNFDCFMIQCVQEFHANNNRVTSFTSNTLEQKKLLCEVGSEFMEFAEDISRGEEIIATELYNDFNDPLPEKDKITKTAFGNKLKLYCIHKKIPLLKDFTSSNKKRCMTYFLSTDKLTNNDIEPVIQTLDEIPQDILI